ncbi:unnamed protein product [Symbiodinium sp. KB8]|nr:unnamed protein product [Symbiodinium sp. KB8]
MAAAEVPTEAGVSEREMGPFEKLCKSGLPLGYPGHLPGEAVELWKKMVLNQELTFLPMTHLFRAFRVLATMLKGTHEHEEAQACLISGPKGVGKSRLFEAIAKAMDEENRKGADGRLTICFRIDLQRHSSEDDESFHERLFKAIIYELDLLNRHAEVAEVLSNLATHAAGSKNENVEKGDLQDIFTLRGDPEALSPKLRADLSVAGKRGRLDMASALLKQAGIAVLVIVDEAEHLFQGLKFDSNLAKRWHRQLQEILGVDDPTIGMVICASFQRSRQLFLSDGSAHDFPPEYTHASLRANWNGKKFEHLRIGGAMWAEDSLKAFLLTHACKTVDPSFTLYREEAETQTAGAAVDATQEPSGAAVKEKMQPSEAALEMARKLDAMFLERLGEDELRDEEKLKSSLERALELYGHTPRELMRAARKCLPVWIPGAPWPDRPVPQRHSDSNPPSTLFQHVIDSFLASLPAAVRAKLPRATMLGFRSSQYVVPRDEFTRKLAGLPEQPAAAAAGDGTARADAATKAATRLIDDAIDKGWLVEHGKGLGLASLEVYRRFGRGGVHGDVMVWMRHDGYGERAELPITRALARMPDQDGDVLVRDEGGGEEDSEGVAESQKQAVKASNSDTEGGQLAGVRMTVVTGRTAGLPAQAAAPAESVGPPHAAAGAGGAGGGGQAAGAEADWSARARAAYEALEQVDESFKEYLALRKGAFWMKELPDVYGGDVIRVSFEEKDGVTTVWIMRVQVKRANQKTLKYGDVNDAGAAAVRKAVEGLMGVKPYGRAKREDIRRKHKPAVRAVGDLIAAAKAMYNKRKLSPHQMPAWDRLFQAYVGGEDFHVEDGGAMIALTHTVPDGMREHVEGQLGIRIVDGTNLRGHWGPLGPASKGEGLYLESAGAKPEEAAGSGRSCTSQDKLDAMFEEFMG